jgi:pyrroloquinoline quinone biosynthesis protein B
MSLRIPGLCSASLALALVPACGGAPAGLAPSTDAPLDVPYVLVLGNAQDAGLPQIGADHPLDEAARDDPARRRFATSVLICDPRSGKRWLLDATPDLREQVELAAGHPASRREYLANLGTEGRPPLFEGVFLTHAHMGHYLGLAHLGREAYSATGVPVHASPRMAGYLRDNGPWSLLVELQNVVLRELRPGEPVQLAADLAVEAFEVPHRAEYSDTYGYLVRGPQRALAFLPDIDKWERWERPVEELLAEVDVALLDATFYAEGEIPGRSMAEIPHPFVAESLERFARLPEAERAKVWFIHLNHTNPLGDPGGEARSAVRAAGCDVARQGQVFGL